MKWSGPEEMNAVCELLHFMMTGASLAHKKAMEMVMKYIVGMPECGLVLKLDLMWDSMKNFKFVILGRSDLDYVKWVHCFLCGALYKFCSIMPNIIATSVSKAEEITATECVQDMLFGMHLLKSMGLKVKKPMVLEVDNKGTKDIVDSWSTSGRTRHIAIRHNFLRELKEEGTLVVKWIPEAENTSDMFTKNLGGTKFERFSKTYVGEDKYMTSQGESVRG